MNTEKPSKRYYKPKRGRRSPNRLTIWEKKFNKKVVTYLRAFKKFYKAEEQHQDFYKVKLQNYLRYKKACKREETLKNIWTQ